MTPKLKEVQAFFELLNKHLVEYMIIGGVAVNVHGYTRATGDLDIWYNPTDENYQKLLATIREFGFDISEIENASKDPLKAFIRIPLESFYIELLAIIDGKLNYYEVYHRAYDFEVNDKLMVKVIGYDSKQNYCAKS
jgi:hypothetical protein